MIALTSVLCGIYVFFIFLTPLGIYLDLAPSIIVLCISMLFLTLVVITPLNLGFVIRRKEPNLISTLIWHIINLIICIVFYAYLYTKYGLILDGEIQNINFIDGVYFSITTWTTLGYGDFSPIPSMRLVTSIEAITGYFSLSVITAVLIMWIHVTMNKTSLYWKGIENKINE